MLKEMSVWRIKKLVDAILQEKMLKMATFKPKMPKETSFS